MSWKLIFISVMVLFLSCTRAPDGASILINDTITTSDSWQCEIPQEFIFGGSGLSVSVEPLHATISEITINEGGNGLIYQYAPQKDFTGSETIVITREAGWDFDLYFPQKDIVILLEVQNHL